MKKSLKILEFNTILEKVQTKTKLQASSKILETLPLMNDLACIEKALAETDEALVLIQRMQRFPLYFSADVSKTIKAVQKSGVVSVEELTEIRKFLDTVKANSLYLKSLEDHEIAATYFREQINNLYYPLGLNQRIKEIITPDGEIEDSASPTLKDIRKRISGTERQIRSKLQEILQKNSSKLTSNLVSIRNDRYVIPVRADQKNNVSGIVHDQSASGETIFIEPLAVNQLNNNLNQLKEDEKREIARILKEISEEIAEVGALLLLDYEILVHLDIVFAKAEYALEIDAKKPHINKAGIFELYNCRHPMLPLEEAVANNLIIGKDYQGIIITGPNTGGKTVLLKTVGLIAAMVKFGMLVPCDEESQVMIFDKVLVDIGDEQSINQSLSTFSAHLKNVIDIINEVTEASLVLLDELGSGTDPAEGSALAIAIFDYLISKRCLVIATSHYSELKLHAYRSENIINASVEFDVETLRPTYKLLLGIPGLSNALKISKMLGLPSEIIEKAEGYAYQKNDDLSLALEKLVNQTQEMARLQEQVKTKEAKLSESLYALDLEKQALYRQKKEIIEAAETESRELIRKSEKKINELLEELGEMKSRTVKGHELAEIKHQLRTLKTDTEIETDSLPEERNFEAQASVYVESFGAYGIIINVKKNNKFEVQIGNATVTVDKKHLRHAEAPQTKNYLQPRSKRSLSVKKNISMTLDLRGKRYEEAKIMLEKFIDDALFGSLKEIQIIHGFGTGVIREMVLNFLKTCEHVESFRFGGANEGGRGVTVVKLKNN